MFGVGCVCGQQRGEFSTSFPRAFATAGTVVNRLHSPFSRDELERDTPLLLVVRSSMKLITALLVGALQRSRGGCSRTTTTTTMTTRSPHRPSPPFVLATQKRRLLLLLLGHDDNSNSSGNAIIKGNITPSSTANTKEKNKGEKVLGASTPPKPPMKAMVAFHQDEVGDWVAQLECGHVQHVRHNPPMTERPWVLTQQGRDSFLGYKLPCIKCQQNLPKDSLP